jgi:hypothetical protein
MLHSLPLGTLTIEQQNAILQPISKEEVINYLNSIKSFKALGPDGFQPFFFKKYWEVVGDDVWQMVRDAFENGKVDGKLAKILVVLIPKFDPPTSFK